MKSAKDIQLFIIKGLFENPDYFREVLTNTIPQYFDDDKKPIVDIIRTYFSKYNKVPEYSTAINIIFNDSDNSEEFKKELETIVVNVKSLEFNTISEQEWLIEETKSFINRKALFAAVRECVEEMKNPQLDFGKIQTSIQKSMALDWNEDLGIEYFDETEFDTVYDYLSDNTKRIPLGIDVLDDAINGGIPGQTKFFAVMVGEAGIGKTAILSNIAVNAIKAGKSVLYITLEIDKKELRKRFDSTYTGYSLFNILELRKAVKEKLKNSKKNDAAGRCIIHEFPPSSVSAIDIKNYIKKLEVKKKFKPELIVVDYLGIMVPVSPSSSKNSYERGKMVSEELRKMSAELKTPVFSATQSNRSGFGQGEVKMDNIADSVAIAHTADLIISIAQPEDLKENNQLKFEIIKSRISQTGRTGIVNFDKKTLRVINSEELQPKEDSNIIKDLKNDEGIT